MIDLSPGAWICLAVSDTGTGITEEVKEHIFEPFFTTKDVGKGTGLGLAQVYGIIRQHEGYINVETEVGEGTTFEIYLEASAKEPMKKREKESTPSPQGQGETILLVEDDGTLRTLAQDILITLGYQVLAASNGQEGLEIYETEKKIDLVITDLIMPKMGGVELIKNIKRTEPDLKALSITGYAGKALIEDVKETGFLDVISKPFEMETFAQKVRQTLDS